MMHKSKFQYVNRSVITAVLISLSLGFAGCSDKKSEDVAAIRATMEKQEADKAKQKQSDEDYMNGVKKGGAAPVRTFKY